VTSVAPASIAVEPIRISKSPISRPPLPKGPANPAPDPGGRTGNFNLSERSEGKRFAVRKLVITFEKFEYGDHGDGEFLLAVGIQISCRDTALLPRPFLFADR
jgi:hypothetical protein